MAKTKTTKGNDFRKEHRVRIAEEMRKLLANEQWDNCLTDKDLTEQLLAKGLFCNAGMVYDIRNALAIPEVSVRKIQLFARQYKNG